jgi:Cu/Ag efflux protein CusF
MKMDGMESMQMKQEAKQAPVAKAEGTIKSINSEKHTVTIAHGAVPAVQWPAMTMAFSNSSTLPMHSPMSLCNRARRCGRSMG